MGRGKEPGVLKRKLDVAKRCASRQDELLADYEQAHGELAAHAQMLLLQLDEERRARREQERTAQRLTVLLGEARNELAQHLEGAAPLYSSADRSSLQDSAASTVSTLRLELERLRSEERAQRRRRR